MGSSVWWEQRMITLWCLCSEQAKKILTKGILLALNISVN